MSELKRDDETQTLTDWLGFTDAPRWWKARPLGAFVGVVLALFVLVALPFAMLATWAVTYGTVRDVLTNEAAGPNLGAGALIAAILGAPFLIWSTVLKHQTLRYQKEGHITDRINKAVEQLGAEKTVERIGRPVTIFTGEPEIVDYDSASARAFEGRLRTKISKRSWEETYNIETDNVETGYRQDVSTWPAERTDIQWQAEKIELSQDEAIGIEDKWQVFKETKPNIEVRIGAILSLERIAQDSTKYDKGRDHVRVMEILCAYVRHNAPRTKSNDGKEAPPPRLDIQKALDVIKRRGRLGRDTEAQERYRLDLRETDMRGYDLSRGDFVGAVFWKSNLADTNFAHTNLTGSQFFACNLENTFFFNSMLVGTNFDGSKARISGFFGGFNVANLVAISIEGAKLPHYFIGDDIASRVIGSRDTEVSESLMPKIVAGRELAESRMYLELGIAGEKERLEQLEVKIAAVGEGAESFAHWNIFTHSDLAADRFRQAFKQKHNLIGWPFDD